MAKYVRNSVSLIACTLVLGYASAASAHDSVDAAAEQDGAPQASSSASDAQQDSDPEDGEIVVTARRVNEGVQSVPASITAFSGDDLANRLVDDTQSLLEQVAGATLVTSGPSYIADISMRGQGGGRVSSSESATGIYRDGHYAAGGGFGGRSLSRLDLFDLARVEVLRGPQGALYGRNAVGGSVNAIARKPNLYNFGGWMRVGYDSFDTLDLEGAVDLPIIDGVLGARVAAYSHDQDGGYIRNLATGNIVNQNRSTGVRAALQWQPADDIEVRLTFENYFNQTPGFGSNGYRALLFNGTVGDPSIFERILSTEAYANIKQQNVYLDTSIGTGIGDLHVNLDYRHRNAARLNEDLSHFLGFEGVVIGGVPVALRNSDSEEFESGGWQIYLTSPQNGGKLTWIVGADGLINSADELVSTVGTATPAGLRSQLRFDDSHENLHSYSAYGVLGYDITPRLNLSLELRVQSDRKSFSFDRSRSTANSTAIPFFVELSRTWTRALPTATLRYRLNDEQNIYARFATGYRPGGFNLGVPSDVPNADQLIPYAPEYVYGGELGWKAAWGGGAYVLNIAAYYTHTQDVQVVTAASATNPQFILQNAGDNHIYGIEVESRARINLGFGRLHLSAAIAANNGSFEKGTMVLSNTGTLTDISGFRVNRTRDIDMNLGADLRIPISNSATFNIGANLQHSAGGYENATNSNKLADYTIIDLTAGIDIGNWTIAAFYRNIGNDIYLQQTISNNGFYSSPRKYGASIRVRF
ncbi:MAG: TonB-dependent receptor [Sphingomonadaceae bacterium]|nr:TonB-dependent receptor [Sphingomonadaceae bacterium]